MHADGLTRRVVLLTTVPGAAFAFAGDGSVRSGANEFPDPQMTIQDANSQVTAINDSLTGEVRPLRVQAYTTGSNTVICSTRVTGQLDIGDMVVFDRSADAALKDTWLRVTAVTPNKSFTVVTEYVSGAPTVSAPCAALVVQRGDTTGAAGGNITSQLRRYADGVVFPQVWISDRRAHTALLKGMRRVLIARKVTAGAEYVFWQAGDLLPALRNTTRAFGAAVHIANGEGATARAYINNSAVVFGQATLSTSGVRAWLSASAAIPGVSTIYAAGIQMNGPPGSTFVIGEFTELSSPEPLADGSFSTPRGQTITVLASSNPLVGRTIAVPQSGAFEMDIEQVSNGVVRVGTSAMNGLLEGQSRTLDSLLFYRTQGSLYNPILAQRAVGPDGDGRYYALCGGQFLLRGSRMFWQGTAAVRWLHVSFDIASYTLYSGP